MKPTDKQDRGYRDGLPHEPGGDEPGGIVTGLIRFVLRIVLLFTVMGVGYAVYTWFGTKWFHVFVFAAIALMLHLELLWIDRHFETDDDSSPKEDPPNPFRKR